MPRSSRVLFALAIMTTTFVASASTAHGAQSVDVVHASVTPGSQVDAHHGFYLLKAKPGTTIHQSVDIANPNGHSVLVDVGGVDAMTSGSTGASYAAPGSTPKHNGTWITFVTNQVQLGAGEHRTLPFTVTVPSNVGPGQYLAAVSVAVPLRQTAVNSPANAHQAGFKITLQSQRIIAVEVDVPGPMSPRLVVRGVGPVVQGDTLRLQFDIANAGNAFAKGQGTVTVADTNTRHDFKIDTFLPHTSIKYAVPWTKDIVPGTHSVAIRLQDESGRIVSWSGRVNVSGQLGTRLQQDLSQAKRATKKSGTSTAWIAWLVVAICIAAAIHLRRRRAVLRRAPRREPSPTRASDGAESNTQRAA